MEELEENALDALDALKGAWVALQKNAIYRAGREKSQSLKAGLTAQNAGFTPADTVLRNQGGIQAFDRALAHFEEFYDEESDRLRRLAQEQEARYRKEQGLDDSRPRAEDSLARPGNERGRGETKSSI